MSDFVGYNFPKITMTYHNSRHTFLSDDITMLSKTMISAYMVRVSVIWSKLGSVGEIIGVNLIAKLIIFIRLHTQTFYLNDPFQGMQHNHADKMKMNSFVVSFKKIFR